MQLRTQIKLTPGLIPGVGFFAQWEMEGCPYSSVKRGSSFRWAFSAVLAQARPGLRPPPEVLRPLAHGSGIQAQFCAAFRYRPARRDDVVGGPSGLGRTAGHAPDDCRRSPSAACLWLQRARQAAGVGGALGRAPLSKGQAVEGRSRDAVARAGAPAQGQVHQRAARFVRRA